MKKDIEIKLNHELQNRLRKLPEMAIDFILSLDNNSSIRTQIAYCKDLNIYFNFLLNELDLCNKKNISDMNIDDIKEVTEKDIRMFLDYLNYYTVEYKSKTGKTVKQGFSNSREGKARKLATLHSFYDYLTRNHKINDPTKHIDIKLNDKVEIKNSLKGDEVDKFVETILYDLNINNERELKFHKKTKCRNATIVLFLAYTGIRISELVQLDIDDIDLKEKTYIVTRKGGDQEKLYLPDKIVPHLENYLNQRLNVANIDSDSKNALFLSNRKQRINDRTVREMLNKYGEKIELNNVTPHTFRRTFGMAFYNATKDIQLTADVMGHATTETTRKFYAKPEEERKRRTLKNFKY